MIKRKGKFLTFCFSLLPGAGHMYLGFMKQGISLMTLFCGTIFVSIYMNIGPLTLLLPIMFCYSFFDTINKNSLSDEDFYALEDAYLFDLNFDNFKNIIHGKFRPLIALALIIIGMQMLLSNLYSILLRALPDYISSIIYNILYPFIDRLPKLLIGLGIIAAGLSLIRGKKKNLGLETAEMEGEK